VTPGEEPFWRELTPEKKNFKRDEGLALKLLSDCLHLPWPYVKDGELVLLGGKTTEDEARRALCRILRNEEPSADVLDALAEVFDPDRTDAVLKAVLKRRNRGHAKPYADMAITEAVEILRFRGKHYDDAVAEVAAKFGKSAEHVKRIFGKGAGPIVRMLPRRPRRKGSIR